MPGEWADDPIRRRKTGIPQEVGHRETDWTCRTPTELIIPDGWDDPGNSRPCRTK
ncbi:hypothetical protein [Streptomyces sp. LBL]|uniref:hypothetical protein n=1 Tax=Streptomyces sp. LBL TaxID=2940562 RepID=UPI0032AF81B2